MKRIYFILFLFLNTAIFAQVVVQVPGIVDVPIEQISKDSITDSEISNSFGILLTSKGEDFRRFFIQKFEFPEDAINMGISGYIKLEFVVEKNGKASEIKVVKGLCESCDAEAIRIVKMANFQVCEIEGVPSRCSYSFPIKLAFE